MILSFLNSQSKSISSYFITITHFLLLDFVCCVENVNAQGFQCNESQLSHVHNWSDWAQTGVAGLVFRVDYYYHNKLIAKDEGRAHIWYWEIRNTSTSEIWFEYYIGSKGSEPKYGLTRLNPGEVKKSTSFTNTPCNESVGVWVRLKEFKQNNSPSTNTNSNSNTWNNYTNSDKSNTNYNTNGSSGRGVGSAEPGVIRSNPSGSSSGSNNNTRLQQQLDEEYRRINERNQQRTQMVNDFSNSIQNSLENIAERYERKANENTYVPNGATKVTCASCDGSGKSDCFYCKGNGANKCSWCYGRGEVSCYTCPCPGYKMTRSGCKGGGTLKCNYCRGSGNKSCSKCAGKGFTISY